MRGDIRRHTDRDTRRAVDEQVREFRGQNDGFLESVVVVRYKVDRVLVYIRKHFESHFAHSRLRITVSSRGVSVDRTEVTVTVDEHISHREILRESDHCVIYRRVAVGMVAAENRTDRVRALTVSLVGHESVFVHRIEYTSVYGFESVPYVGKSTRRYNGHRVVEE